MSLKPLAVAASLGLSLSTNIQAKMVCAGTSGVVGVHYNKGARKWVARISPAPLAKVISLGSFFTKEEAAAARRAAEQRYRA